MKNQIQPGSEKGMKRKNITVVCALVAVLVLCTSVIGGTVAYLLDITPEITNVFELGELNYKLIYNENKPAVTAGSVSNMPVPSVDTAKVVGTEHTFVSEETPTLTGYTFQGWADEPAAEKPDYPLNPTSKLYEITVEYDPAHYEVEGALTTKNVYAVWEPITYTVKYSNNVDPNNSAVTQPTGTTADSTHTYDVAQQLTENGFARTGYTFIGWNTQPDGHGKTFANTESVKNLTTKPDSEVTLYAQWGVKSYVLRYHANGGKGTMPDQVIEWDKLTKINENKFTAPQGDYKFAGWSTTPDGEVEYLENQQVVNLLESGTLDLYAVWKRNSYTVTFDYNIGYGTPPTKEVLYGEEYGVLPPYLTTETENLFKGWYTAPEGGVRVYPSTIVDRKEDHTLWAHWDPSPANDIIQDLVVHSSADDDNDGVADEMHLEFVCSSYFEKFNIPLHNLVPGQTYALTYTTSNNASFGDIAKGYSNARYGSYILPTATEDAGNINTAVAQDIIATWADRIEADGNNDGSHAATNDAWLNGPWKNRTITFTATNSTMYWAWEFGLIQDGTKYDYNIYDIELMPVAPKIEFANKIVVKPTGSTAAVVSQTNSLYATEFVFDGDGGCETVYYPITGLSAGSTYTITFDHKFTKNLISSDYDYGCGIMTSIPSSGAKMAALGTWASNVYTLQPENIGVTESVTLTFKATDSTAYWVWNMARASDSINSTVSIAVTRFSANHGSNNDITYYTASSNATAIGETYEAEELPVIFTNALPEAVTVIGIENAIVGQPWALTLTSDDMPQILKISIDGWTYVTGLNEALVQSVSDTCSGLPMPAWLVQNEDGSLTLTIPAEYMTNSAIITLSGEYYNTYSLNSLLYDNLN